jgi:hypothetical protein
MPWNFSFGLFTQRDLWAEPLGDRQMSQIENDNDDDGNGGNGHVEVDTEFKVKCF